MFLWRSLDPKNLMTALAVMHKAGQAKTDERPTKEAERSASAAADEPPLTAAPINATRK